MNSKKRTADDAELQSGFGVYVEENDFKRVIAKYPNEQEVMSQKHFIYMYAYGVLGLTNMRYAIPCN
jgi:hypothetical protein